MESKANFPGKLRERDNGERKKEKGDYVKLFGVNIAATEESFSHNNGAQPQIHSKKHNAAHKFKRLGKGNWKGISENYVTSRTPIQVASHAQKYFLRLQHAINNKEKRRPSLFDKSDHAEEVTPNVMQSLPFLHTTNSAGPRHGYIGKAHVAVCAPADHPSPRLVQDNMFRAASSAEKDLLELKIAPPQSSNSTTLQSQPFIRVVN
ncbi:hypothetical protein ES288_A01G205400v1 [Gossypium darwinii]|uniref:HTH myb-type domain-containing protein n=1 Tax=Gossypium darwinii TaxID=34276 RepID=A0A5D2HP44_GOSDA|nr:hypothetical protein ES288_A01G205400v1 [Gossypium darwinii]